ncbi:inositol monophosphatase family protein [Kosakonia sp. S42]|uniref:inositol monophosphatase family protein n=1 Tax=Kosakonia sp. S42 TaxID=2767458 RepID=UPI0035C7D71A
MIDPGTFNFVRGGQNWAVPTGLYENRRPVFGVIFAPVRNLMLSGGQGLGTKLNGTPMMPAAPFGAAKVSTGLSWHPSIGTDARLEALCFISDELKFNFRFNGSATLSLIEVAMGETYGYLSLVDATWDLMGRCRYWQTSALCTLSTGIRRDLTPSCALPVAVKPS